MTAFNKSVLWLNHRNLAGCGKLRVFRPERETARGILIPVAFSERITITVFFMNVLTVLVTNALN